MIDPDTVHPTPDPNHNSPAPVPSPQSEIRNPQSAILPPDPIPQNSPPFPIPKNIAPETPQIDIPLSHKQQTALNRLFAGEDERFICQSLKIDRKTLYNWKRRHPAFMAEMHRRSQEVWADVAGELRQGVIEAVHTLRHHLTDSQDMTQLRAARALISLVNSPRLHPTEPTTITGVLDHLLRATTPPPSDSDSTTFTDTQRQALLNQLLTQNAAIEAESQAARQARQRPDRHAPPRNPDTFPVSSNSTP